MEKEVEGDCLQQEESMGSFQPVWSCYSVMAVYDRQVITGTDLEPCTLFSSEVETIPKSRGLQLATKL